MENWTIRWGKHFGRGDTLSAALVALGTNVAREGTSEAVAGFVRALLGVDRADIAQAVFDALREMLTHESVDVYKRWYPKGEN